MQPKQLIKLLATAIRNNKKVLVKGAPGIGKSDIIEQAAALAEANLVLMHPSVSDPTDFKGMPALIKKKDVNLAEFLPFGDLRKLLEAKALTVCFIDDIGQAPHAVQAALMQLIQARAINGHKISEHVVFVGATNDSSHMAGVSSILEPVKSRWNTIVELKTSVEDWKKWALSPKGNMPPVLIAFIELRPELLSKFEATRDLTNSPSPRSVASVGGWVNIGVTDPEIIGGAAGEAFAAEFTGFLRVYQNMPSIDSIKQNPDTALLPQDPAPHFAVCAALTHFADDTSFPAIHTYLQRLASEWQMRTMKDVIVKHPALAQTSTFITWATNNAQALA
jgi:hypothetical protein